MNSVNVLGRLVEDPEIKLTSNQTKFSSFRIAVDNGKDSNGQKRPAYFFTCVAWQKTAENIARYFSKGQKIAISGILTSRNYETSNGEKRSVTEILVNGFDFCSDSRSEQPQQVQQGQNEPETAEVPTAAQIAQEVQQEGGTLPFEI